MGIGLLSIPNSVNPSNVFVAASGVQQSVPSRTYPYYLPKGFEGLCRNTNLSSYMPKDGTNSAQLAQQQTISNDIGGPGGDEVSTTS